MSKPTKSSIQKLSKYKKEEILEAMEHCIFFSEFQISEMLTYLQRKTSDAAFEEHDRALQEEIEARKKYLEWESEVCRKYGDGKSVKLIDIPPAEINRGAALERAMKAATEKEQRLSKQIDKILNI